MAKQIKAIKCPQCGSSSNTKISEDRYKCNSCNTEYFLDNDDININVNHQYKGNNIDSSKILKRIGIGALSFIFIIIFINACGFLFRNSSKKPQYEYGTSEASYNKEEEKDKFDDSFECSYIFENGNKDVIVFSLVERKYGETFSEDSRNGYYFIFTNLLSNKIVKETKIDIKELKDRELRTFFNGKTYLLINKRILYEVNRTDLSVDNVTETILKNRQEFTSGTASIEFVYEPRGSGFKLMTNLGKEYFYYPIVDKVYTENTVYDAGIGFRSLLPVAKDVTYYEFSSKSDDFKDEPIQLLKIVYKSNCGGPEDKETNPRWFKDFGGSGIFTELSPYTKRLFRTDMSRIVSYKDLTPERLYFAADVKYFDDKVLIIKYRPTIADDAPIILQCLDIDTYEIKWTLDLDKEANFSKDLLNTSQGYIAEINDDHFLIIDVNGKITKNIKLERERIIK